MSATSHTRGPWKVSVDPQPGIDTADGGEAIIYGGSAMTFRGILGDNPAQMAANAHLIAAAPDLLAALQGVLRVADRATVEFDAARAAIAKATNPTEAR